MKKLLLVGCIVLAAGVGYGAIFDVDGAEVDTGKTVTVPEQVSDGNGGTKTEQKKYKIVDVFDVTEEKFPCDFLAIIREWKPEKFHEYGCQLAVWKGKGEDWDWKEALIFAGSQLSLVYYDGSYSHHFLFWDGWFKDVPKKIEKGWNKEWVANVFAAKEDGFKGLFTVEHRTHKKIGGKVVENEKKVKSCGIKNKDGNFVESLTISGEGAKDLKVEIKSLGGKDKMFTTSSGKIVRGNRIEGESDEEGSMLVFENGEAHFRCKNFLRSEDDIQHLSCRYYIKEGNEFKEVGILGFLPKGKTPRKQDDGTCKDI